MSENEQKPDVEAAVSLPARLKKTIVMVGMMGAGKTAVGRALAARLNVPFLDSDHEIEAAANLTIPEIFARDGVAYFRQKERQVISRLLSEQCGVLSTGGGAFLSGENRGIIKANGVSLWLQADLEVTWNRVKHRNTRPLLQTQNPRETLSALYEARVPMYAKADLHVPSDGQISIEGMVDRALQALKARPDVLEWT
ncbi:MAG: shikimate kinase [Rhodobacteraceae bacterium]|nr:shikimate kinase [Paracoccaceae bacterium]